MPDLMVLDQQRSPPRPTRRAAAKPVRRPSPWIARIGEPDRADLGRWLPEGAAFSLRLGVLPLADRQGGVGVLVLADREAKPAVIGVRLIGMLEADHTERGATLRNDHLVAVAQNASLFETIREISELDEDMLRALTDAWIAYNVERCASFQVVAARGAAHAVALVEQGVHPSSPSRRWSVQAADDDELEDSRL
ncbi:MAG: hypothetical protein P4L73_01605 [Caulobacteraceae bacterium]|nr:hypothetical protein [Caulobacteraceae bacterium]